MKNKIKQKILHSTLFSLYAHIASFFNVSRKKFGYIHPTAYFRHPLQIKGIQNVYMEEGTHIFGGAKIISTRAKFIMKKYSGAAEGLTVVSGNHTFPIGDWAMNCPDSIKQEKLDRDIIVEEDVFLLSNVTLLSGVTIGRGAVIGSGAVVRSNIPPYAIVVGNPAKVIGFKYTPEEIIEHEKQLYSEEERIPLNKLEKNYNKYFYNRREEIADYLKV